MSCCPTSYWCTASGPQPGVPSTDGETVYPPPGALSGPYESEEKAWLVCVGASFPCGGNTCSPEDDSVPLRLYANFVNKTGAATALPNSIPLGFANELLYPWSDLTPPPGSLINCSGSVNGGFPSGGFGYSTEAPKFGVINLGSLVLGITVAWGGPSMPGNQWWVRVAMNAAALTGYVPGLFLKNPVPHTYPYGIPDAYLGWNYPLGGQGLILSQVVDCGLAVEPIVFEGVETWTFMTGDPPNGSFDLVISR